MLSLTLSAPKHPGCGICRAAGLVRVSVRVFLLLVTSIGLIGMASPAIVSGSELEGESETEFPVEEERDKDVDEEALRTSRRLIPHRNRVSVSGSGHRYSVARIALPLRRMSDGHCLPNGLPAPLRR